MGKCLELNNKKILQTKTLELIQVGTWRPLCSERASFTFETGHQQERETTLQWPWGETEFAHPRCSQCPQGRGAADELSREGQWAQKWGGPQKRPEGEASPGHVTDIRAREEPGTLPGTGSRHIPERERNAAWRAAGLAPGVQGSEGPRQSRRHDAPLHQGPLHLNAARRASSTLDTWRASLASAQALRRFLLQAPSKNKLLQDQRGENTQTSIRKYSKDRLRKGLLSSCQRQGLTYILGAKSPGNHEGVD